MNSNGTDTFQDGAGPVAAGHTPGPWRIGYRDEAEGDALGCESITITAHRGMAVDETVCEVPSYYARHERGVFDARLIAAAPDLLAQLINITERFHSCCMAHGNDRDTADASCEKARAAIAKATTRSASVGSAG